MRPRRILCIPMEPRPGTTSSRPRRTTAGAAGPHSAASSASRRSRTTPIGGWRFVRAADNALWHVCQIMPNGSRSGWQTLSGQPTDGAVASRNADGRLEVFVKGTDPEVYRPGPLAHLAEHAERCLELADRERCRRGRSDRSIRSPSAASSRPPPYSPRSCWYPSPPPC